MKYALEFLAIITVSILPGFLGTIYYLRKSNYLNKLENSSAFQRLLNNWLNALASIAVVLLIAYQQPNGFASIGIQSGKWINNIAAVLGGVMIMGLFISFLALGQRIIFWIIKQPPPPHIDSTNPAIREILQYQDVWERRAYLTVLPFSAISEELILRGYFILFLGGVTNNFLLWSVVSIFLTVWLHLYQGTNVRMIITNLLLAIFFTWVTIRTQNIVVPITAHIFMNLLTTIRLWKPVKNQNKNNSIAEDSDIKAFAFDAFTISNLFILVVATIKILA